MTDPLTDWVGDTENGVVPPDRESTFESPWQARAFALTVALYAN